MVTIQGKVVNALDDTPLKNSTVIAKSKETEIQQQADDQGIFSFQLPPGTWRITARREGFVEPEAYFSKFSSDTTDLNFELREGYSISGWVIEPGDGQPQPGVVIKAVAEVDSQSITKREITDDKGKFHFSNLHKGKWELEGTLEDRRTEQKTISVGADSADVHLILARKMSENDWRWGWGLFLTLSGLLIALVLIYTIAHNRTPAGREPALESLTGQVVMAREIVADINAKTGESNAATLQSMRISVASLKKNWDSLSTTLLSLTKEQKGHATSLIGELETAANVDNAAEVGATLAEIESVFNEPNTIYFWFEPPLLYLEVLFWSLVGILVSLLVSNGYYLYQNRFYPEGIWMHVSHLLAVPVLALVFVFLISQVQLNVQVGDSEVALNLNDPRILIAIAFIVAVRPWGLIDFVRETGSRFFSQIRRRFGGESETEPEPRIA